MTAARQPVAAVVGYLSLDTLHTPVGTFHRVPGGAALYSALAASAAGAQTDLLAAVGTDIPEWVLDALGQAGVDLAHSVPTEGPCRRTELVETDRASAERHTLAYAAESWWERTIALAPCLPPYLRPDVVVLTPMPADVARRAIRNARSAGARVVMDTSEAFAATERADLLRLVAGVDVFAPSRAEIALLTGQGDEETARRELAARVPVLVEKRGAHGARLSVEGAVVCEKPSHATCVRDATGAGDALVATFAVLTAAGLAPADALEAALDAAARAASAVGPAAFGVPVESVEIGETA